MLFDFYLWIVVGDCLLVCYRFAGGVLLRVFCCLGLIACLFAGGWLFNGLVTISLCFGGFGLLFGV